MNSFLQISTLIILGIAVANILCNPGGYRGGNRGHGHGHWPSGGGNGWGHNGGRPHWNNNFNNQNNQGWGYPIQNGYNNNNGLGHNQFGQQQFPQVENSVQETTTQQQQWTSTKNGCVRPQFEDAQFSLANCESGESFHIVCSDHSILIPIGWKGSMICTQGRIRIKKPSTCSESGDWSPSFPLTCSSLLEKYANLAQLKDKIPLSTFNKFSNHPSATTIIPDDKDEEDDDDEDSRETDYYDDYKDEEKVPFIKVHEKQCPMIRMQLSENFRFSCFINHQSPIETTDCIHKHTKVPSGTIAFLKCKPPWYSKKGEGALSSEWVCKDGAWEGDFNRKMKCYMPKNPGSKRPTRPRPNYTTTSSTTTTTTPKTIRTTTIPNHFWYSTTTKPYTTTTTVKTPTSTRWWTPNIWQHGNSPNEENYDTTSTVPVITTSTRRYTTSSTTTPRSTTTTKIPSTTTTSKATLPSTMPTTTEPFGWILPKPDQPSNPSEIKCPPLKPRSKGMVLECVSRTKANDFQSEQVFVNGCDIPQVVGAEAKYSCKQYYEATGGLVTIYRKCKEDGTWGGSAENYNCVAECGRKNEVFVPYITSGKPSFKGQWPWHSAVFLRESDENGKWEYICGSTLVSSRTVLTAAHCLTLPQSSKPRNVSSFRFDLGRFKLDDVDDIIQTREVESIHLHSSYSPFGYDSDIAIVILREAVNIGYHVRPICFPQSLNTAQEELQLSPGSTGTVVGWGFTEEFVLAQELHMAQLKVVSQESCAQGTKGAAGGRLQIKSTTFCAAPGFKNDSTKAPINVCTGDSGGGMYFPLSTSNSDFTRWYLQGIVSVGIGDENNRCKASEFSFFTRVGRYVDWMIRVMSENDAL